MASQFRYSQLLKVWPLQEYIDGKCKARLKSDVEIRKLEIDLVTI
jgi:hypothetical protein